MQQKLQWLIMRMSASRHKIFWILVVEEVDSSKSSQDNLIPVAVVNVSKPPLEICWPSAHYSPTTEECIQRPYLGFNSNRCSSPLSFWPARHPFSSPLQTNQHPPLTHSCQRPPYTRINVLQFLPLPSPHSGSPLMVDVKSAAAGL